MSISLFVFGTHNFRGRNSARLLVVMVLLLTLSPAALGKTLRPRLAQKNGQSLRSKLSKKATFVPKSRSALEQLIEVARYYQIPMGIEWDDQSGANAFTLADKNRTTVQSLISAILRRSINYQAKIVNGVLHIAKPALVADRRNFLNLRIPEFHVDKANIFDAEALLRLEINMTLHPERHAGGYGGGYGHAPGGLFDVHNITFSARNLAVRDILNKIVVTNANALWVVRLNPSKMMANEPFFAQDEGGQAAGFYWQFIPLGLGKAADQK